LGLTYKPGTDTLRRSSAIELCRWLLARGAKVRAHDPAVSELPSDLASKVELVQTPLGAAEGATALVVCTAWPEYRDVPPQPLLAAMERPVVIDAAGWLAATVGAEPRLRHVRVGSSDAMRPRAASAMEQHAEVAP
jgi:UDPglucose 6-dehydrogenase